MFHLVNNLTNKSGDALVGYYVKLKDSGGTYATLYSDTNLTPIATVSGLANAAKTDANGMYDLYVADGDYDIEFFDKDDSSLLVTRIPSVPMYSNTSVEAATEATLAELASTTAAKGAALVSFEGGNTVQDLSSSDASKGAALVGYRSRTVRAKLDDWCTPLDFGAAGDGTTDDTTPIDTAMATGKHVIFPKGYTFKTNTSQGHAYSADKQIVEVNGDILYSGTRHVLPGGHAPGFHGIFTGRDKQRIQLFGSGKIDGAMVRGTGTWGTFSAGDNGSGLFITRCAEAFVDGLLFTRFISDGIKAVNCPDICVGRQSRFYDIYNIGVELNSDATDVFNGGIAWVGATYGPSGKVDGFFELIDDQLNGAGNGCGVDFSSELGAERAHNLTISGHFTDVLLPIWSENNFVGSEAQDIVIDAPQILGNVRGAATVECSDGIGLVGVQGGIVRGARIRNQTNLAPPGGAETVGINIVESEDILIENCRIVTDTGIANRMQHAIKISASDRVTVRGGGQTGVSSTPILQANSPTDVRIEEFEGATTDETWGNLVRFTFALQNIGASTTAKLLVAGETGAEAAIMPCPGRPVSMSIRASDGQVFTGTYHFWFRINGVEEADLRCTSSGAAGSQANFATVDGSSQAVSSQSSAAAPQLAKSDRLSVLVTTDGSWTAGHDAYADVWVDVGMKA